MSNTKFTNEHEWVEVEGNIATIGITNFAQEQLGDIVFVELPAVDDEISQGDEASVIESVKAAGEVKSPVSGVVTEVNEGLDTQPDLLNSEAEGDGWIFKVQLSDESELESLMDKEAYDDLLSSLE